MASLTLVRVKTVRSSAISLIDILFRMADYHHSIIQGLETFTATLPCFFLATVSSLFKQQKNVYRRGKPSVSPKSRVFYCKLPQSNGMVWYAVGQQSIVQFSILQVLLLAVSPKYSIVYYSVLLQLYLASQYAPSKVFLSDSQREVTPYVRNNLQVHFFFHIIYTLELHFLVQVFPTKVDIRRKVGGHNSQALR